MKLKNTFLATACALAMMWTTAVRADPQTDAQSAFWNLFDVHLNMYCGPSYSTEECWDLMWDQEYFYQATLGNYFFDIVGNPGWNAYGCGDWGGDCGYIAYAAEFYSYLLSYILPYVSWYG